MAAATSINTEYGYMVTGDTGAVTVNSGKIWVKAIAFSGNATNATALITHVRNNAITTCLKFKCYDAGGGSLNSAGNYIFFGDKGIPLTGLAVTLSNAGDHISIFIK